MNEALDEALASWPNPLAPARTQRPQIVIVKADGSGEVVTGDFGPPRPPRKRRRRRR